MSKLAIYPGTFDPVTNGHLDIIERVSQLFDEVVVAVATNPSKSPLFSDAERLDMIRNVTAGFANVRTESFSGLLVDYAEGRGACAIVRGLRAISDFEYEFQMALVNRKISRGITTVFLMAHEKYTYINSSIVKEVAKLGGDVSSFVPPLVFGKIKERFGKQ